jgi:hypothetical protein
MSDRFDVLERFAPLFEPPEPAFERFLHRRDRRRRNQRIAAGVVGITVFVTAIWIVTAGTTSDRSVTPATSGPTVAPNLGPYPMGLVGLPPEGSIPSYPWIGDLVVDFGFGHTDTDGGRFHMSVYEDGRVIWERFGNPFGEGPPTGLIEQRLTPEGVELIRDQVLAVAPFDGDLHYIGAHGLHYGQVRIALGGRLVSLSWGDLYGGEMPEDLPEIMPTAEQAEALRHLDARLGNLEAWLPATAWAERQPRPFIPQRFSACFETHEYRAGLDDLLDSLPRPAQNVLLPLDWTHEQIGPSDALGMPVDIWCTTVITSEARVLARTLEGAGYSVLEDRAPELAYRSESQFEVVFAFIPLLPHQR